MLDFLRTRLQQGFQTSSFPEGWAEFPERFRGRPALDAERCPEGCRECAVSSPSAFIRLRGDGAPEGDVGACLFSPEETAACPHGAVWFTPDHQMASATRDGLVSANGGGAPRPAGGGECGPPPSPALAPLARPRRVQDH